MDFNLEILLASKSPRRQELIQTLGYPFQICSIDVEEDFPSDLKEAEIAEYLSLKKANGYTQALSNNQVLLTADTIVCVDDSVLNKPADVAEATQMLEMLSGRSHKVITGVTLKSSQQTITFSKTTEVTFKVLTSEEIAYYIENYKPFDKAGAYGIQEWIGYIGITNMKGSYFNVVGLPIQSVYEHLQAFK